MTPAEYQELKAQMQRDHDRLLTVESKVDNLKIEMDVRTKDRNDMVNQVRSELGKMAEVVEEIKINTAVTNKVLESLIGLNEKVDSIAQKQFKWSALFWAFGITGGVIWTVLSNFKETVVKWLS